MGLQHKPLSLYIFSNSTKKINYILENTSAGGCTVNGTLVHAAHPELPFGGVEYSGTGAYHGKATFDTFTHMKPVCQLRQWPDGGLLSDLYLKYPPWNMGNAGLLEI